MLEQKILTNVVEEIEVTYLFKQVVFYLVRTVIFIIGK